MPPTLNTAHQHVSNAENYFARGLLIPASEEHYKAAETFMACIEHLHDEKAKRTMKLLYEEHSKAGKELQRKIAQLREENKDPSLPQITVPPPLPSANAGLGSSLRPPSSPPPRRMTDSQQTVDESFMVLGQRSDPGDAFNQFWQIMEGMLDNLSQPVAFATAPLSPISRALRGDGSSSSDTDHEESMTTRVSRRIGLGRSGRKQEQGAGSASGWVTAREDVDLGDEFDEESFTIEGDELSESFCLVPSGSEPTPSSIKKENTNLKVQLDAIKKQLAATERVLKLRKEQDQQLKDSIVMARREAHRAMGASTMTQRPGQTPIDFSSLNLNIPSTPIPALNSGRNREAQYLARVRELEEEVRTVKEELRSAKVDNEKQKAMIAKFRERWEKLKESAKRKKEAKANAEAASSAVRERIDEEPEAEAEVTPR